MDVSLKNYKDICKRLDKLSEASGKAVQSAVKDVKKAAPGKAADAVRERYNIKKKDITAALVSTGKGTVQVKGVEVENVALLYRGRPLAPSSAGMFNLTPKERPEKKAYKVAAKITQQKSQLGPGVFIAGNGSGANMPFQRVGEERLPIKAIKTVSVPQMITNEEVSEKIMDGVSEKLQTRLDHYTERALQKL